MKKLLGVILTLSLAYAPVSAQITYNSTGRKGDPKYNTKSETKGFDKFKIITGGGLTLGLGTYYNSTLFRAGLSPILGYKFNDWFSAGISLGYQYFSAKDYYRLQNPDNTMTFKPLRQNLYRGGVWTRLMPIEDFFAHIEFEHNIMQATGYQNDPFGNHEKFKNTLNVNCLLVGIGYRMPLNERVSLVYTILYDALQNTDANTYIDPMNGTKYSNSPYANTFEYRVSLNFGF